MSTTTAVKLDKHVATRSTRASMEAPAGFEAARVLGTLELLFKSRDADGTLPNVSRRLGQVVRTNSEAIPAIMSRDPKEDLSRGPGISSDFYPDPVTHITQNRFASNQSFMRVMLGPLVDGERPGRRAVKTLGQMLVHPVQMSRLLGARNFAKRGTLLTVMQYLDNEHAYRANLRREL